jgi:predicted SAM-dependent methyltransferase
MAGTIGKGASQMTMDPSFADWDWEDPDALAATFEKLTVGLARCETLECLARPMPVNRQDFLEIGVTGIEFAAFKTRHSAGLGTDLVGLHTPTMTTEPGLLYRADGASYFTQLDISEKLPFGDGCVEWVYAEHLIEHVPPLVAIGWLTEVRRILTPGGLLRITTPDLSKYAQGYVSGDSFFTKQRRRLHIMRFGPPMPERRAFMLNQIFYLYGHRWLYDLDELRYALARAGFASPVQACAYQVGARPDVAALDTVLRRHESIYVEVTA